MGVRTLGATLALLLLMGPALAAPDPGLSSSVADPEALERALGYLAAEGSGSALMAEALAGAGLDPMAWPDGEGPLPRLQVPEDPVAGLRAIHAVAASGHDPRAWPQEDGTRDLIAELRGVLGSVQDSSGIGDDAFAVLALVHAGGPLDDPGLVALADVLAAAQQEDGGWTCAGPSSVDCTGFAVAALVAAGRAPEGQARQDVLAFLERHVEDDGGVRSDDRWVPQANTNSAAWLLHAHAALGGPAPEGVVEWVLQRQRPDGGFAWVEGGDASLSSTLEVLPLLAGRSLPWPVFRAAKVDVKPPGQEGGQARLALHGEGFNEVRWTGPAGTAEGPEAGLTFPGSGTHFVRVHATGEGHHFRAQVPVEVPAEGREAPATGVLGAFLVLVAATGACGVHRRRPCRSGRS